MEAGGESELEAWYEQEHLPGSAAVPGCLGRAVSCAVRRKIPWSLRFPPGSKVTESAPWLAVPHTDWCSRARPLFRKTRRTLFIRPDLQP
jgi:hypothetical protein